MTLHKITEFYTEWFSVCPNITSKFRTIVIFKNWVKQNNDSNKTCRFYFSKGHLLSATVHELSPQNKLWIFAFNWPCSYFLFWTKMVSLKVGHPLKFYQCTKFHVPTLTGASFASISEVWTSAILEWLKVRD
jgi:hypothetical protein